MSLEQQLSCISIDATVHPNSCISIDTTVHPNSCSSIDATVHPNSCSSIDATVHPNSCSSIDTTVHPILGVVNEVIQWHKKCSKKGKKVVVNNLFLQSLFSKVHNIYKTNKNALHGWKYGAIYKSIYDKSNIDITKANVEFYYSIMS